MPNWCENELRVAGWAADLAGMLEDLGSGIPARQSVAGGPVGGPSRWTPDAWTAARDADVRFEEIWLRVEPWGAAGRHRLEAVFLSADEPPTGFFVLFSKRRPRLLFELTWREGLTAKAGLWVAIGGRVLADANGRYRAARFTVGPFGDPLEHPTEDDPTASTPGA